MVSKIFYSSDQGLPTPRPRQGFAFWYKGLQGQVAPQVGGERQIQENRSHVSRPAQTVGPTMLAGHGQGHGRQGHRPPPVRHGLEAWLKEKLELRERSSFQDCPLQTPQQRAMMLSSLLREKDEVRERIAQQKLKIPVVTIGLFNGKPSWPKWPNFIPLGGHQVHPSRFGRHVFTHSPVPLHGTFQRSRLCNSKVVDFFGTILYVNCLEPIYQGIPPQEIP